MRILLPTVRHPWRPITVLRPRCCRSWSSAWACSSRLLSCSTTRCPSWKNFAQRPAPAPVISTGQGGDESIKVPPGHRPPPAALAASQATITGDYHRFKRGLRINVSGSRLPSIESLVIRNRCAQAACPCNSADCSVHHLPDAASCVVMAGSPRHRRCPRPPR